MKRTFLLFISLALTFIGHAQGIIASPDDVGIGLNSTQLVYFPFNIAKSETLDSTLVSVSYNANYVDYNIKGEKIKVEDMMCLQIGPHTSKFFSANLDNLDRFKTFNEKRTAKFRQNYIPYIIYKYNDDMTVVYREPFEVELANEYKESICSHKWNVCDENETIIGYDCTKAITEFRGRVWTVWFTTDLPFNNGPWKLQGLPGLILKAEDSKGEYSFEATEINQEVKPITKPRWKTNKTTYKKWKKVEKSYHESPYFYFAKGGERKIFNVQTSEDFTSEWSIPYNPIELE